MGSIWQDNRTGEQKRAAEEHAVHRRQEWDDWHAANPTRVVVVQPHDKNDD
ncbi:hypothetical protein [Streptomyces sp.]|uniref:hypothetical protein n=1 Tax=Streptomyces sp. TaxID=1931 RepID=UPI002F942CDC